jgi:hypothetical protein
MVKAQSYSAAAASLEVNSSAIPDILILVLVSGCKVGRLGSLMPNQQFIEFTPKDCWCLGSRQATAEWGTNSHSHGEGWMAEMARTRPLIVASTNDCPWHSADPTSNS